MVFYDKLFSALGLSEWCGTSDDKAPLSLADLAAQAGGQEASGPLIPIPSFDNLHESCNRIWQSRDVTNGIEEGFLAAKPALKGDDCQKNFPQYYLLNLNIPRC